MQEESQPRRKRRRRQTESRRWLQRLEAVECPDVTYVGERFPIVMKRARGLLVTDVDGNRYRDFTSCFGVLALGHRHPAVLGAMRRQAARLVHGMGDVHPSEAKVRLLEMLVKVSPYSRGKCILSLNGGDAVDAALKTAMVVTGRHRFVSFEGGYHGLGLGPLALCSRDHFRSGFEPWIQDRCTIIPFPRGGDDALPAGISDAHGLAFPAEVLSRFEEALRGRDVAAVVVEPLQGRGGDRTWPPGFLRECAAVAKKYGTLLIFDEIFTGIGRTGTFWAHEAEGVVPDLLCVGKALGGGFPLSACVGECLDAWGRSAGEARHTSTFLGHPMACAVGKAVLDTVVRDLPLWQRELPGIERELTSFQHRCSEDGIAERLPFVLRGRGFMRGIWFHSAEAGFAAGLAEDLLETGYIVLPSGPRGDVLSLTPPLTATAADYASLLNALHRVLAGRLPSLG